MWFKNEDIQIGDCVGITRDDFKGWGIRLVETGWNFFKAWDKTIPSHSAIVCQLGGAWFIAQMMADGLQLNSIRTIHPNYDKHTHLCSIKRIPNLTEENKKAINDYIVSFALEAPKYDFENLLAFVGMKKHNDPTKLYCSELCERVMNKFGFTYADFHLNRHSEISPLDIQLGKTSIPIVYRLEE